jgi:hypothetical protein
MNAGMPTYATQKPCQAPMRPPITRLARIETYQGQPQLTANTPETAPMRATTEPTDRSMWPAMMIITMPIARIRM